MQKIIDIPFKEDEETFIKLQDLFNTVGPSALFMNHYELAEQTAESSIDWKHFLLDPRVAAVLGEELELIKKTKVAIMLNTVDTNKNTGQAQLLNTLLNQTKDQDKKEGPVFIYTQVPLNEQEQGASNVVIYKEGIKDESKSDKNNS